jgi:hypothetical protein
MSEQSESETERFDPFDSREDYINWLDENVNEYECARCGATVSGESVETRFGPVDLGCYLMWRKSGKIQQRNLSDFQGGAA